MKSPEETQESDLHYPSSVTPDELKRFAKSDTHRIEIRQQNSEKRLNDSRSHKIGRWVIGAVAVPGIVMFSFNADQQMVAPVVWGIDSARTHLVGDNNFIDDGTGTVVLTFPGLGIRDSTRTIARPLVPSLSEGIPNSRLFSLEEGSFLHLPNTIQAVRDMLAENPTNHLILYGMSTGGKEMLYVMAALREEYPELKMTFIADSTPFTKDTAYELRDDPSLEGFAEWMSDRQLYGGPAFNSIADLYFSSSTRKKYIDNIDGFDEQAYQAEIERIGRDIWNSKGTPTALRIGQVALVTSNKMEEHLTAIAKDDPSLPPITFIYIANSADHTVDTEKAIAGYRSICNNLDMRFVVIHQDGLPHASENDNPDIYNQNITIALNEEQYFEYTYAKAMLAIKRHTLPKSSNPTSANAPR